jgi:hypothetical protein
MWWVGHMGEWQSRDPSGYSITERDGRTYLHDPSGELLGTFSGRHSAQHEADRHSKLPPPIRPIEIPQSEEYTAMDRLCEELSNEVFRPRIRGSHRTREP